LRLNDGAASGNSLALLQMPPKRSPVERPLKKENVQHERRADELREKISETTRSKWEETFRTC
jgi:hypothetical protein